MTEEDRSKIVSNDFADLIINYEGIQSLSDKFPGSAFNIIDSDLVIAHIPVENITVDSISKFGYYSIPACYGLLTVDHHNLINDLHTPFTPDLHLTGSGVLLGFIDTGIDYRNPAFLNSDGTTRIAAIWDQTIKSDEFPTDIHYGTEYNSTQINQALQSDNPLSIVPSTDEIGHGTMLAGVAAGSPNDEYSFNGVANQAEFLIVKLKQAKPYLRDLFIIPQNAVCFQENDIITAARYLNQYAVTQKKPLVICLGLGTTQSDHTGNRPSTRYLTMLSDYYGRSVIMAAGNEGNRASHYYGNIHPPHTLEQVALSVGESKQGFSLQFWGTSPNSFWIDLFAPDGEFISRVPPITGKNIVLTYKNTSIIIDSQIREPFAAEQFVIIRLKNPQPGVWYFNVSGAAGDLPMQFHFWLPITNFISKDTVFLKPNNYTTVVAPGNSSGLITVTAYNPKDLELYYYASKGFTVNNLPKPDVTAPGVNITSPYLNNTYVSASGTSISSAYVSGIAALLLQWGVVNNNLPELNNVLIKKVITQSASRNPTVTYPNPDWGYGIIDLNRMGKTLNEILAIQSLLH